MQQTVSFNHNNNLLSVLSTPGFLSADECSRIVELSQEQNKSAGIARGEFGGIRDPKVCFLSPEGDTDWIFSKLLSVVTAANQKYRFHLSGFREPLQVAEYESGGLRIGILI